ncbi:hypothetical protein [Pelagibaculum spongiae]|uniref:DUF3019 domain-containing protein n=1 Tax=Pelagibaculum spongiae TaxID=2080658 RepID=A0A2V1GRT7_9GAMM|nr:hypothetical protein [Pelagibaculum spongiae]PVZ64374.1 hypothetical protein DC094_20160 [Pelagibaculum spongiae]
MEIIDKALVVNKSKILLVTFFVQILSNQGLANENLVSEDLTISCNSSLQTHLIQVEFPSNEPLPCRLILKIDQQADVLWTANYQQGFCEKKQLKLVKKYQAEGFVCQAGKVELNDSELTGVIQDNRSVRAVVTENSLEGSTNQPTKPAVSLPRVIRLK